MKRTKIYRIFSIAVLLSLLILAIPAAPALAFYDMTISPTQGAIGQNVIINGSNFPPTADPTNPQIVLFYFSSQDKAIGTSISTDVTIYRMITQVATTSLGQLTVSFNVPSTFSTGGNVNPGVHYIYVCTTPSVNTIRGKIAFTIIGAGDISINVNEGPVDTPVVITGTDFSASQPISFEFGSNDVPIESGSTTTGTNGSFTSTIYVPEIEAGSHTIKATVGTGTSAVEETVQFTVTPDIVISPQSGEAGTSVSIIGTGFARRKNVDVYYNSNTLVVSALIDTKGSFYTSFLVPEIAGLTAGAYSIEAEDVNLNLATTMFTLNIPQPEPTETEPTETEPTETEPTQTEPATVPMNISASDNIVGSLIGISGAGFTPGAEVVIKYDEYIIATTTSDAAGLIVATFYAPPSKAGDHIITATDGIVTGKTIFTMESIAPEIPEPLRPKIGAKVKSPISFDWEDVVDNSATSVTYMLQIATDEDFSTGSIVLEKTDINSSEYTLSDMEEEELAGLEDPYYWRIQAIDVASNESGWTDPMEVYISPPFSFPTWLYYTLLAVGAVVIFVVGYWLGRRTAFMY